MESESEQWDPARVDESEMLVFHTKNVFGLTVFDLNRPLDSHLLALGFEGFLVSYLDSYVDFCPGE